MAPRERQLPGTRPTERKAFVDSIKSSVFRPSEVGEDTHPDACYDGLVFLTYTVFDDEVGDEVEKIEAVPCHRCTEEGGRW
jgi:hypothetical protein